MNCLKSSAIYALTLYRNYLSPMKIHCCRFYPSCSEYALVAIDRYGLFWGLFKGFKRILRCQPLCKGGYDPVR